MVVEVVRMTKFYSTPNLREEGGEGGEGGGGGGRRRSIRETKPRPSGIPLTLLWYGSSHAPILSSFHLPALAMHMRVCTRIDDDDCCCNSVGLHPYLVAINKVGSHPPPPHLPSAGALSARQASKWSHQRMEWGSRYEIPAKMEGGSSSSNSSSSSRHLLPHRGSNTSERDDKRTATSEAQSNNKKERKKK